LNGIGFKVDEEWIGSLLLAGLPEEYKPMIMGLESSGTPITGDAVKTKLLQDIKMEKAGKIADSETALHVRTQKSRYKGKYRGPRCFSCNDFGHISSACQKSKVKDENKNTKYEKRNKETNKETKAFLSVFSTGSVNEKNWYLDSGATAHVTMDDEWLNGKSRSTGEQVITANKDKLSALSTGDIDLQIINEDEDVSTIKVKDVLYVPGISANLLSVSKIAKKGYSLIFNSQGCKIVTGKISINGEIIAQAVEENDMYCLRQPVQSIHYVGSKDKAEV